MNVAALAAGLDRSRIDGDPDVEIGALACNARDVTPGSLFFCIPGLKADGHDFAPQALAAGAVALVCERTLPLPVTQVLVPRARHAMALIAARFFGDPTRELRVAAVTGTNGKTTTAHLLSAILAAAGLRPALLGTVGNRVAGVERDAKLTTPDSLELQRLFREMVEGGDLSCVMEASSHALALERTTGITFESLIFTNLSRDHLDFHPTFEAYFAAKRSLFLPDERRRPGATAVINEGDEYGRRLASDCRAAYGHDLWTFALEGDDVAGREVDCRAIELDLAADRSAFTLDAPRLGLRETLQIAQPARFNVANALAAATAALAMGLSPKVVREGLAGAAGVPGRVEPVSAGQPFAVLVDYSHTPDSLASVLVAVRAVTAGRVLTVFGCGGDRDRGKRPLMGAVAARLADLAVVTSDNPRSEDPLAIIAEILDGLSAEPRAHVLVEPDRRAAIALALREARPGDALVIAGKGHESYQILGPTTIHFDDREVAAEELAGLGFSSDLVSGRTSDFTSDFTCGRASGRGPDAGRPARDGADA
jgi:UDP-N-acetylmuramoyl-L-alanyl-D-glutamate--2,6-diaminopimelate ligase